MPAKQSTGTSRRRDLSGRRFFGWRVLHRQPTPYRRQAIYLCRCECGVERPVRSTNLVSGATRSCGCRKRQAGVRASNYTGYQGISGTYWYSLVSGARNRNLVFRLSKRYIWALFQQQAEKCALTGWELKLKFNREEGTASLDRIDNSKGYIRGNVQWVHKDINKLKHTWPLDKFLALCRAVAAHPRGE